MTFFLSHLFSALVQTDDTGNNPVVHDDNMKPTFTQCTEYRHFSLASFYGRRCLEHALSFSLRKENAIFADE